LPLPWFRRRKPQDEQAPGQAAAHERDDAAPALAQTPAASDADPAAAKAKRRRGSRGGRSRKRGNGGAHAEQKPERKPEAKKAAPKKAEAKKAESKKPEAVESQQKSRRRQQTRRRVPKRAPLPAAKRELLVSVDVTEQRVAVLEDGRVAEVYLERPHRRSIAGNIYKGVVDNVLPGMEAAFVEIGLEKNGFLYVDEIVVPELEGRRHGKRIQDLLSRGQEILVQAVKDPMKTKGARLTTEISLPGRFVVFVPQGEGIGVSRRLDDEERARLKEILRSLDLPQGGLIVRTAAEGASADDIERDIVFLQRLWRSIEARAKEAKTPALVYQEAELPLRVIRDLFTGDFEHALVDHDRTLKRINGYLKKTSPHMAERVERYREKQPLFEAYGVDAEIRSTLSRRVDLPSGGYLVFDYAEAFTVIDVNTGRFVGSRSKTSTQRLEDTITKNNLEAVKEVVRQLRLRDIGGIIVIDFIDMANPKNRQSVEEALQKELERDRTKTYVVEISPLGLVEMTRQNVTDGPREILTKKCPTCGGDGIVVSEATTVVEAERRLRSLAASKPRVKAFRVELNAHVAERLIGPGATLLAAIEAETKRRFFVVGKEGVPGDHFVVLEEGTEERLAPEAPVKEGQQIELTLVEVGLHDGNAGVAKLDGYLVNVGDAAKLVGKKVKARVERVLDGVVYATLVGRSRPAVASPITAESEAEKPTRKPPARKGAAKAEPEEKKEEAKQPKVAVPVPEPEPEDVVAEAEEPAAAEEGPEAEAEPKPKRKTRRGSRGGRGRKKKAAAAAEAVDGGAVAAEPSANGAVDVAVAEAPAPTIHLPDRGLGAEPAEVESGSAENGAEQPKPRKRTRRGSRGGRNRRKRPAASAEASAEISDGD
jgi:ribonuclease G